MKRVVTAFIAYGLLGALCFVLLTGKIRYAVLILLAGLALKTLVAHKAGWGDR